MSIVVIEKYRVTWYTSITPWYTLETVTAESILDAKPGPGADAFVVGVCLLFPEHRVGERWLHQLETETMIVVPSQMTTEEAAGRIRNRSVQTN